MRHMVDILDKVRSGAIRLQCPEDAVELLAERMGVSEEDLYAILELVEKTAKNEHL